MSTWFFCLSLFLVDMNTEIQQERTQQELIKGIESFNPDESLKHAETQEKNPLPTKEIIEQEKAAESV